MNKQIPVGTRVRFKPGSWQLNHLVSDTAVVGGWDGYHTWVLGTADGWVGDRIYFDNSSLIQDEQDMKLEKLIKEAEKRGIVPGAFVESAFCPGMWRTITGRPYSPFNGVLYAPISGGSITVYWDGKWSNVKQQQDMKKKLEPRTVCDTTPAQQQYIYQRAKELGIMVGMQEAHTNCPSVHYTGSYISRCIASTNPYLTDHVVVSFAEFCERMENTAEEKITVTDIGGLEYEVKFEEGKVVIGCFELSNGLVADIFECIKPQDHVKVKGQHLKFNDIDRYVEFPGGHRISYDDITKVNEKLSK